MAGTGPDGRFGGRKLRMGLSAVPELEDADSVVEMVMGRLLEAAGLKGSVHHHVVDTGGFRHELGFAFLLGSSTSSAMVPHITRFPSVGGATVLGR